MRDNISRRFISVIIAFVLVFGSTCAASAETTADSTGQSSAAAAVPGSKSIKFDGKTYRFSVGSPVYVTIGDSYFAHINGYKKTPDVFAEFMGIEKSGGVLINNSRGGYGVARPNKTFLQLVSEMPSSKFVTDVLIYGGIFNDRGVAEASIEKNMKALAAGIAKKYPNARIMYASGSWSADGKTIGGKSYQQIMLTRRPLYEAACKACGIRYLKSVETALQGNRNSIYFNADGHHPSTDGKLVLASALTKAVLKLDESTKVKKITLSPKTLTLARGRTATLKASVKSTSALVKTVYYISSDTGICSVNMSTGAVTAVKPGKCTITCAAADGSGVKATCRITVSEV
ncbi:MAG: Ig-like domain-containing protein [Lachnospiraceae bacterium]|nr:Ig-like domain-containing protein [Lachnospiraceae bacterium]